MFIENVLNAPCYSENLNSRQADSRMLRAQFQVEIQMQKDPFSERPVGIV